MRFADEEYSPEQLIYVDLEFPTLRMTRVRIIFLDKSKRDFLGTNAVVIRNSMETIRYLEDSWIGVGTFYVNPSHITRIQTIVDILNKKVYLIQFENEESLTLDGNNGPRFERLYSAWMKKKEGRN